jgi:hypothetical protein
LQDDATALIFELTYTNRYDEDSMQFRYLRDTGDLALFTAGTHADFMKFAQVNGAPQLGLDDFFYFDFS